MPDICAAFFQRKIFDMNRSVLLRLGAVALAAALLFAWYKYRQPRFIAGDKAPDIEITLTDGQQARLSDLKGKYVLLHFWGSWCGPCRAENPHLAAIYRQYQGQGFDIFSIGIEQSPQAWKRAIERDSLVWRHHAMESGSFDGGAAQLYNIKVIPSTFLINPEGDIMGVNLTPEQIGKTLAQRLADR
jgi:thiol-disulfide isomerase/thioredoxin